MGESHDLANPSARGPANASLPAAFPVGPPETTAPTEQGYRSLSLVALIGFGVAAVYAAIVLLLGLVALRSGKLLLLGSWAWLVPLLTAAVCLVARLRIVRSEGTLAGAALARWGLLLSLFVGLSCGAYSAAIRWALYQQAESFAQEWLDLIAQGQLDRALFRTLPPVQRANISEDDKKLLEKFAPRVQGGEGGDPASMLNRFTQMPLMQLMAQGGKDCTITSRGVRELKPEGGGFKVVLSFQIATPESSADVLVTVHGSEATHGEFVGRQWQVMLQESGVDPQAGGSRLTPVGEKARRLTASAHGFLQEWGNWLAVPRLGESFPIILGEEQRADFSRLLKRWWTEQAFLLTLPEEQREQAHEQLHRLARWRGSAGPLWAVVGEVVVRDDKVLSAYQRFREGSIVEVNPRHKGEIVTLVRKLFSGNDDGSGPPPQPADTLPSRTRKGKKLLFDFVMRVRTSLQSGAEVTITVEGNAAALDQDAAPHWRIARVRLTNVRTASTPGHPSRP